MTKSSGPLAPDPEDDEIVYLPVGRELPLFGMPSSPSAEAVLLDASRLDTGTLLNLFGDGHDMQPDHLFTPSLGVSFPSPVTNLNPKAPVPLPWYLEPESWDIDSLHESDHIPPFCSSVLNSLIESIQGWLARWVDTWACPFIHSHIYKHQSPRCIQDAYTALSTYRNRTPGNKAIILSLIEERVKQLLNDQPTTNSGVEQDSPLSALTPFEHLARVHALMIYQVIGLYDGDIRLRHVAETQIPTLNAWLRQLIQSSQAAAREGPEEFISSLLSSPNQKQPSQVSPPQPLSTMIDKFNEGATTTLAAGSILSLEDTTWYAWFFAETIRRTWLVACSVQTVYLTLQVGWAPCPGGLPFTSRGGLFSAGSASLWASKLEEGSRNGEQEGARTDFVRRKQGHEVFEQTRPEEVGEFARRMFEIVFGLEVVQRWMVRRF